MTTRTVQTLLIWGMLLPCISCMSSSRISSPPTTPDLDNSALRDAGQVAQTQLWGFYDVYIDVENKTATPVPCRGTMFTANVVTFLNANPSCLKINIIGTFLAPATQGIHVDMDITLKHPFSNMPQYNGYDVRGIFIGNGSDVMKYNSDLKHYKYWSSDQDMYDWGCVGADPHPYGTGNPDGFTRWWNPGEFLQPGLLGYTPGNVATPGYKGTATLNPYKYFGDGLGPDSDLWQYLTETSNHGVFSSGSQCTRNYYIEFPKATGVKFNYAIAANWGGETVHPSNAHEPLAASVVESSDLYYISPSTKGGDLVLDFSLFTWGSQPDAIYVESPVLSVPHKFTSQEMTPTETGEHYAKYHVKIPGDNITGIGDFEFWIIAEHSTYNYQNEFGVPNMAGADPLAAFFRGQDYVHSGYQPSPWPISINPSQGQPNTVIANALITVEPNLENGPSLGAKLVAWGSGTTIQGSAVSFIDSAHMKATFNLNGAPFGGYYVKVANGDGTECESADVLFYVVDPNGWVQTWGGYGTEWITDICVDGGDNIYVGGWFWGPVDFDPGPGITNKTSAGNWDGFVSKFNSAGAFQWVKTWGGTGMDGVNYLSPTGNYLFISYTLSGTEYLQELNMSDGSPAPSWSTPATKAMYAPCGLSADNGGAYWLYAKTPDLSNWSVAHYSSGKTVTAQFDGPSDFYRHSGYPDGNGCLADGSSVFVVGERLYSGGKYFVECRRFTDYGSNNGCLISFYSSGASANASSYGYGIARDPDGDVIISGQFTGSGMLLAGYGDVPHSSIMADQFDCFVTKVDCAGVLASGWPVIVTATSISNKSYSFDQITDLACDISGNVYISGLFQSVNQTATGGGPVLMNANNTKGNSDAMVARINSTPSPSGSWSWAHRWGSGMAYDYAWGIAAGGSTYAGGSFTNTVDFAPVPPPALKTSNGEEDCALVKYKSADGLW